MNRVHLLYEQGFYLRSCCLILMGSSKNVIPSKAEIHNILKFLDPRLRGSDRM
jgi:hypothetical protein